MPEMRVQDIIIGERRRSEVGDVTHLAADIRKHGLLHPIVVTAKGELIAGERRLRAYEHLGRTWIAVTQLGDVDDEQLRDMELSENIHRLDLTQEERDRLRLHKIGTAVTEAVTEELRSATERKSRGRPPKPASTRNIAQRTNIPTTTVHRSTAYAAAIAAYPLLESWTGRDQVIEARKVLDKLEPELRQATVTDLEASGLRNAPALNYLKSSQRGRITSLTPGATTTPTAGRDEQRVAALRTTQRVAALTEAHKHLLLAAREFDDERGVRIREIAGELKQMLENI